MKDSEKKCGILNSNGRILCLLKEENCPLNDFFISKQISQDSDIVDKYIYEELMDNFSGIK